MTVFVPVAFMGGIVGRFMKSFGLTMAFAIVVSLVVSFTLTPMLSARFLKLHKKGPGESVARRTRACSRRSIAFTPRCSSGPWVIRAVVRGRGRPRALLERAAVHGRRQELHAGRRSVGVRSQHSRARRDEPGVDGAADQPDYQCDPEPDARGDVHAGADRRRRPQDAEPVHHLRAPEAHRGAAARPVRGDGRHPQPDSSRARERHADIGAAGRQHRRRRQPERRHPVHHQRAGSRRSSTPTASNWWRACGR